MATQIQPGGSVRPISDSELRQIVQLVYEQSGINLHEGKRELVEARLQKRMRTLGITSYKEYLARVEDDGSGEELQLLLDSVATNFTSFLREPAHFEFLRDEIAPAFAGRGSDAGPAVWCAASSTGEEPVTIALTLLEAGVEHFSLLGSDISTKALAAARQGVYNLSAVRPIPMPLLKRYFQKGRGAQEGLARVSSELRRRIEYRQVNLIAEPQLGKKFDIIFCRNVMIYFDRPTQQRVVAMLERHLAPGGFLFISHSESLNGITHGLKWVRPAIYQKGAP
jgi:chemotaxis protein methyltransferase CheR